MSISIAGLGWVTPLGAGLDEVWARLMRGDVAEAKPLTNPETGRVHQYAPIPPNLVEHLGRQPRLRRASPIAYYSVAAGLAALQHAGLAMTPEIAARTAVLFAISSGSVVYTRKFFEGVVKSGANAASPMLFPETVYNAPASHLAAQLGIDGYSYTLVGDNSIGLGALKLGEQLLISGEVDYCLVVGAEEIDWVLCEGYSDWRFGALLAEGAGAVLLTRGPGLVEIAQIHDGVSFASRAEAVGATARVWEELQAGGVSDLVIGSANGSWTDRVEAAALPRDTAVFSPKLALGEALGASALWQVIAGALALQKRALPLCDAVRFQTACVISTGVNQQASGLVLQASLRNP
jgi:3-oxoacyl-(acyl-carrier-protein) synthase